MKRTKTSRILCAVLALLMVVAVCPIIALAETAPTDSIDFLGAQLRLDKAGIRFVGEFDVETHTSNANGLTVEYGFLVLPTVAITDYAQPLTYENTATLKISTTDADQLLAEGDARLNGITPTKEGNKILLAVMKDMPEAVIRSQTSFSAVPFVAYLDGTTADQVFYGTTKEYNGVEIANKAVNPETTQEPLANRISITEAFQGTQGFQYILNAGEIVKDCENYGGHDYNTENTCKWCGDEIVATEGLQYTAVNNEYRVSDYTGTATDVVIAPYYQGIPVTSIGYGAFRNCSSLESIAIPSSVTTIGKHAFYGCSSLESVDIPSSVTMIDGYAFYNCSSLQSITIPSGVTTIGQYAFFGCSSLQYHTYDNAKYLGNSENAYMVLIEAIGTDITSCAIHPNTKVIGSGAFYACSSLESITIPSSVVTVNTRSFGMCSNLQSVTFEEGSQCTDIGNHAFYKCSSLESVDIPSSVTTIGQAAFSSCSSLQSILFEDTDTWYATTDSSYTNGTQTDVTDPAQNVAYFTNTNQSSYWYKQ